MAMSGVLFFYMVRCGVLGSGQSRHEQVRRGSSMARHVEARKLLICH